MLWFLPLVTGSLIGIEDDDVAPDRNYCGMFNIFGGGEACIPRPELTTPHMLTLPEGGVKVMPPSPEELGNDEYADHCDATCSRQTSPDVCMGSCAKSCRKYDDGTGEWMQWYDCCMLTSCFMQEDDTSNFYAVAQMPRTVFRPDLSVTPEQVALTGQVASRLRQRMGDLDVSSREGLQDSVMRDGNGVVKLPQHEDRAADEAEDTAMYVALQHALNTPNGPAAQDHVTAASQAALAAAPKYAWATDPQTKELKAAEHPLLSNALKNEWVKDLEVRLSSPTAALHLQKDTPRLVSKATMLKLGRRVEKTSEKHPLVLMTHPYYTAIYGGKYGTKVAHMEWIKPRDIVGLEVAARLDYGLSLNKFSYIDAEMLFKARLMLKKWVSLEFEGQHNELAKTGAKKTKNPNPKGRTLSLRIATALSQMGEEELVGLQKISEDLMHKFNNRVKQTWLTKWARHRDLYEEVAYQLHRVVVKAERSGAPTE